MTSLPMSCISPATVPKTTLPSLLLSAALLTLGLTSLVTVFSISPEHTKSGTKYSLLAKRLPTISMSLGGGSLEIIAKNIEDSIWVNGVIVDRLETANVKVYADSPQGKA